MHVSGRDVVIFARPTLFWQRRSVERALESLPALSGLRANQRELSALTSGVDSAPIEITQ